MDERPTPNTEKPSLEYEQRVSFVSRRQYRRLMALTLLNTILLAGFIVGPSIGPMVKSQWQQFQSRREQRRIQQQRAAAIATAKAYVPPAGLVVYEERPDEAAKLLAATPSLYQIIRDAQATYFPPRPWHAPVQLKDPPVPKLQATLGIHPPIVFLHAVMNPAGEERLVGVALVGKQLMSELPFRLRQNAHGIVEANTPRARIFEVSTQRVLVAATISETGSARLAQRLELDRPGARSEVHWMAGPGGTDWIQGEIKFKLRGLFRIYAGRVDPADASRFTIDYEIDGQRGTIDGRLREDDIVELLPRAGVIVDRTPDGRNAVWDPYAAAPATRP